MTELAGTITPFEVKLTGIQLVGTEIEGLETGILWLNVQETQLLRQLHDRLNQELAMRFENTRAAFDGPEYHFHMTVALGNQPIEIYQKILDEFSGRIADLHYTVREMAMFVYDEMASLSAGYMTYMVLPLGK